jgi:hypothetical protein
VHVQTIVTLSAIAIPLTPNSSDATVTVMILFMITPFHGCYLWASTISLVENIGFGAADKK